MKPRGLANSASASTKMFPGSVERMAEPLKNVDQRISPGDFNEGSAGFIGAQMEQFFFGGESTHVPGYVPIK